jgi:hypothetical protein
MRERVRNVLVGICTIGALGGAALLLFLFGEIEPFLSPRWSIQVAMNVIMASMMHDSASTVIVK